MRVKNAVILKKKRLNGLILFILMFEQLMMSVATIESQRNNVY